MILFHFAHLFFSFKGMVNDINIVRDISLYEFQFVKMT